MRTDWHVTYEIVTPESAEHGDNAESGFVTSGNWRTELPASVYGEAAGKIKDDCGLTLREALELVSCGAMEDSGQWFSEIDSQQDYRTGAEERRSLHPPKHITPASYNRIRRIVTGKGI